MGSDATPASPTLDRLGQVPAARRKQGRGDDPQGGGAAYAKPGQCRCVPEGGDPDLALRCSADLGGRVLWRYRSGARNAMGKVKAIVPSIAARKPSRLTRHRSLDTVHVMRWPAEPVFGSRGTRLLVLLGFGWLLAGCMGTAIAATGVLHGSRPAVLRGRTPSSGPNWLASNRVFAVANPTGPSDPAAFRAPAVTGLRARRRGRARQPGRPLDHGRGDGRPRVGRGHGLWANNPTSYSYQWLRCHADGPGCTVITRAASSTYVVSVSDVGFVLLVRRAPSTPSAPADRPRHPPPRSFRRWACL